jgi:hypothetical protein
MNTLPKYDEDSYSWFFHTAQLLREKRMNEIDIDHLIEEMEDMGKSYEKELINRLTILVAHLLKWQYQSTMKGHSWKYTIIEQRDQIVEHLRENPGLKSKTTECLKQAYKYAISRAAKETGLESKIFPTECPYTWEQIINDDFYPE